MSTYRADSDLAEEHAVPELPEVETMCRGIAPIVGSRIVEVVRPRCRLKPIRFAPRFPTLRRRILATRVSAVSRLGKRVVVELDHGDRLVLHPRMAGLVLLADPPDPEHLRLRIRLDSKTVPELLYWDRRGLGTVDLFRPTEFEELSSESNIGPDALSLTPPLLRQRLERSRRAIKVALLDQRAMAGIGNLYASEILHVAGLNPKRRCHVLRRDDWQRLHAAMHRVLEAAIRDEGSTLSDGTYRNAQNRKGTYQSRHLVYAKAGQPCAGCGWGRIRRIVQAQRSTFFCPVCQPRRPVSGARMAQQGPARSIA